MTTTMPDFSHAITALARPSSGSPASASAAPDAPHDPALVYLTSLAPSGRRTMRAKLASVARIVGVDAGTLPWSGLRFEHVTAIRAELQAAGKSPATINATLSALRGVARAAWHMNQINAEDYHRIQAVRSVPGARLLRGRALAGGELAALMTACAADETAAGARDAALIALLFAGGLRRSECVALDAGDYDEAVGELRVRGKGNKERLVYLTGGGAGALADWLLVRGTEPGPLVVPVRRWGYVQLRRMTDQAVYSALLKRVREAGLKPSSPHDLRRTFVSELLDRSADVAAVQRLAGHASVTTTVRYDRRGEAANRKAAALLHLPYRARVRELPARVRRLKSED